MFQYKYKYKYKTKQKKKEDVATSRTFAQFLKIFDIGSIAEGKEAFSQVSFVRVSQIETRFVSFPKLLNSGIWHPEGPSQIHFFIIFFSLFFIFF